MRTRISVIVVALVVGQLAAVGQGQPSLSPSPASSLKFAVIGDNGDGSTAQYELGAQLARARGEFAFEFVLMVGDNMYGGQSSPKDFAKKFEQPYSALLSAGVPFFAALGNHDSPSNRFYEGFNMGGRRYYEFTRSGVLFVVLDTNMLDPVQLEWADAALARSTAEWKIVYFHHPIYSDGDRHGSNVEMRVALEPMLLKYGVTVVFSGHDHIYLRYKPQNGITYFVEGSSGKLRKGGVEPTGNTAAYFDQDLTFMLVEIAGAELRFRTLSRAGLVVDSGVIRRRPTS